MNENKDMNPERKESPEVGEDGMTQEQRETAEYWDSLHSKKDIPAADLRDCEQDVAELQSLLTTFEAEHSLEELHAIDSLTAEEAPHHPIRRPAHQALIPITTKLNLLKKETNITTQRYDELYARYRELSKAVGFISAGKVRHD
jgi:hypothetical protein